MKKWEKFSDEELKLFVKESLSFRQLAEKCGYDKNGGSYINTMKNMCLQKNFDTSHFTNKLTKETVDIENIFNQQYHSREVLKKNLILLRGHKCEFCKLTKWNNKDIPLQVHHKDGNGLNNTLNNLELLCPNCHSQTDNYCGKNKQREDKKNIDDFSFIQALKTSSNIHQALIKLGITDGRYYKRAKEIIQKYNITFNDNKTFVCKNCGEKISNNANMCTKCYQLSQRKVERPSREELKDMIRTMPFTKIGQTFNVTDNAIRKWCLYYELPTRKIDINNYTDEQWELI